MVNKIFFQSSLPRAGSTLLQQIMGQNPDFYVTPTSGLVELLTITKQVYTQSDSIRAQDPKTMELAYKSFLKNAMFGYFNGITDKPYVLDKNRGWISNKRFLNQFYPNPKIVYMVRDIRAIYTSLEKAFRKNPLKFTDVNNMVLEQRINHWITNSFVAGTLERLKEGFNDQSVQNVFFIKYEEFVKDPKPIMENLYQYLELPYFEHNFDKIEQITEENDIIHGIYGDHKIKNKLMPVNPDWEDIIGKEISDQIWDHYFWFNRIFGYEKNAN